MKRSAKEFKETGCILDRLYRAVRNAAHLLPEMDLTTDAMRILNNKNGFTVHINPQKGDVGRRCHEHHIGGLSYCDCCDDCDDRNCSDDYNSDSFDDEEEGLLYDGD